MTASRQLASGENCGTGALVSRLLDTASVRILVAVLAFPCLGALCVTPDPPPPPDDCSTPGDQPIGAIALGPERLDGHPFEPWSATDTAYVTHGAQGGSMLGISLELAGDLLPACLAQRTELRQGADVHAVADVAINTYEEAGGTRTTSTLWLVFEGGFYPQVGSELDVVSQAGDLTASVHLQVVSDRHRLLALTPAAPTARVGDTVEFLLDNLHAPAGGSYQVTLSTAGDPGVLTLPATTAWIDDEVQALTIPAAAVGTAELVVGYADQEVRAPITVEYDY